MQNNPLLNQLAFDIVKDKVIEDKTKAYMEEQEKKAKEDAERQKADGLEDLEDELDSEEERIMQQELEKRRKTAESKREEMAKKLKNEKYGNYTEIIETEFLDTMLKNEKVVCHFYHKDFERCKKVIISDYVNSIDDVETALYEIEGHIINFGKYYNDKLDILKSITYEELINVFNNLDLNNNSLVIMNEVEK